MTTTILLTVATVITASIVIGFAGRLVRKQLDYINSQIVNHSSLS